MVCKCAHDYGTIGQWYVIDGGKGWRVLETAIKPEDLSHQHHTSLSSPPDWSG